MLTRRSEVVCLREQESIFMSLNLFLVRKRLSVLLYESI
ncbi:hypothetical protein V202x_07100 [Gimesia aquarii]|uniref:Uncharacterized protein n=1 Tax=Gimesia aquarii TaxID=2527964 RepID=A0A517WQ45_9PLAN|nr:hypothetical protein V202x_07100 [Gimesia aquarii]